MIEVNDNVIQEVARGVTIPAKPELLAQLQALMQASEPDLNEIATLISADVGIAAKVLKTINSPFYGLARTVVDIHQAVVFLGLIGVQNLVTGLLLIKAFDKKKCCVSLERFWDTATDIGNVALFIGNRINRVPVENLYTLGLFHDCGIPLLAMKYDDYVNLLEESNRNKSLTLSELEEKKLQTNHSTVGYFVASSWNLPREICQLVLRHHDQSFLEQQSDSRTEISWAVLKMAENIVSHYKNFMDIAEWPGIQHKVYDCLAMDEDDYQNLLEDLESMFDR